MPCVRAFYPAQVRSFRPNLRCSSESEFIAQSDVWEIIANVPETLRKQPESDTLAGAERRPLPDDAFGIPARQELYANRCAPCAGCRELFPQCFREGHVGACPSDTRMRRGVRWRGTHSYDSDAGEAEAMPSASASWMEQTAASLDKSPQRRSTVTAAFIRLKADRRGGVRLQLG